MYLINSILTYTTVYLLWEIVHYAHTIIQYTNLEISTFYFNFLNKLLTKYL